MKNYYKINIFYLFFQNLELSFAIIVKLICFSFLCLIMLVTSQLPTVLNSEHIATIVSLITVTIFASGLFLIASSNCPIPMFALLLAVHAMLPISRISSFIISGILLIFYFILFTLEYSSPLNIRYVQIVSFSSIINYYYYKFSLN